MNDLIYAVSSVIKRETPTLHLPLIFMYNVDPEWIFYTVSFIFISAQTLKDKTKEELLLPLITFSVFLMFLIRKKTKKSLFSLSSYLEHICSTSFQR